MKQYLEILFADEVRPNDLEIVVQATPSEPGRARLVQAHTGSPHPDAPNSVPLFSQSGAKIGFVVSANLIDAPFATTYLLEDRLN